MPCQLLLRLSFIPAPQLPVLPLVSGTVFTIACLHLQLVLSLVRLVLLDHTQLLLVNIQPPQASKKTIGVDCTFKVKMKKPAIDPQGGWL